MIYGPFTDELWTATRGGPTRLNGRVVRVSSCANVDEAIIAMGFSKSKLNLEKSLPHVNRLSRRAMKIRIMGSAALELAYVASGRLDAYIERTINLWDIAAGALLVECCRRRILHAARPGREIPHGAPTTAGCAGNSRSAACSNRRWCSHLVAAVLPHRRVPRQRRSPPPAYQDATKKRPIARYFRV